MTDRMEKAIEYRDLLKEIKQLEAAVFGDDPSNALPLPLLPAKKPGRKGGARVPIDKGKLFALKNAKWTNKEIAEELNCSEGAVANIITKEREAAQDEGREPRV